MRPVGWNVKPQVQELKLERAGRAQSGAVEMEDQGWPAEQNGNEIGLLMSAVFQKDSVPSTGLTPCEGDHVLNLSGCAIYRTKA
jgi:hypothetical protein